MNRDLVEFNKLKNNREHTLLYGKSGNCYIVDDKIYKIYKEPMSIDSGKYYDLSKFEADTIVFPNEYFYEKGKRIGEVLNYIPDKDINQSFNEKTTIHRLIANYERVLEDFYTYNNLKMIDICSVNILYSNKQGFHVIDTTEWEKGINTFKRNIFAFNSSIIDRIFEFIELPTERLYSYVCVDKTFYNNCLKYGKKGGVFVQLLDNALNDIFSFQDLLYSFMEIYQIHYNESMNNLDDMKKYTKILKKY